MTMIVALVPPFDTTPLGLLAWAMAIQGSGKAATLENVRNECVNPNGVVSILEYATPLGLMGWMARQTQSSGGAATLG